ncbi:glycosyltransferase [Candidatus Pelagibacter sp.]|jgi:polyisoprenyl-phosphate glycosyltransferase|nr:glycosyltransferase [Candidatus Pelagibacter sp.]|tara:strand:- start:1265 stop:2143 length:879 start_codon:yes stop_codon:yes gene_type:complete
MKKTKILIPIHNDWQSVFKLLEDIDNELFNWNTDVSVLIINDASTEKKPESSSVFKNLRSIKIINMKKNKGHARCIAAGLKYINENEDFDFIIPMDGDGEDRPIELGPLLCKAFENPTIAITGNRVKRSEGIFFRFCYQFHKFLTFIFTGHSIKFGNYSCIPKNIVMKMVNEPATWSSFSGSLSKIAKDRLSVPSIRGSRYFGSSQMNFVNLLKHSLSIIAVFKTTLLIRSSTFLIVYLFLTIEYLSIIMLIPFFLVLLMILLTLVISKRENLSELNNSLHNIDSIKDIKVD